MKVKIWLGTALALVILTASFYILMPEKVRIDFTKTRTIFSVYNILTEKFDTEGIEYVRIFDGTTLMRAKSRIINYTLLDGRTIANRTSFFKDNILIEEIYKFDNDVTDVENVPISHNICFTNAKNKIFEYMIDRITYDGETEDITSPFSFGKNMKLTFQDDYYRAKVYNYKYASDKIKIRYRVTDDYQCFDVRMFDPEDDKLVDPIRFGINIDVCDYEYIVTPKVINIRKLVNITTLVNITVYKNETSENLTYVHYKNKTVSKKIGSYVHFENQTICHLTGYKILNKILNFSKCGIKCSKNKSIIQCDMCPDEFGVSDGNCNGILESGESGIRLTNITSLDWYELKNRKIDSFAYTKLRNCFTENI